MKYINISLIFLLVFLMACQKDIDLTDTQEEVSPPELVPTMDLTLEGSVGEYGSLWHWTNRNFALANVTVKLMFSGGLIDETNTSETGSFSFDTQPVPIEGAYLLFESHGYHNNVVKVDTFSNSIFGTNLLKETFPGINGEVITNGENYIKLKGTLQDPTTAHIPLYYITNADNELVGTATPVDDFTDFTITTVPDQELFLHYKVDCYPNEVIPIGSFTEDTDLGILLDQSIDFSTTFASGFFSTIYDCPGNEINDYSIFFKNNGLTEHSWGTAGYAGNECDFLAHPVIVTLVTQNPRMFQEKIIDYSTSTDFFFDMTICTDDNTFIKYSLGGGAEVTPNLFTYANLLPTGELLLKQKDPDYDNGIDRTFLVSDTNPGIHTSDLVFYNGFTTFVGCNQIETTITMNDGEFVEGTFIGDAYDGFESSLGTLEGSFRARIQ